MSDMAGWEEAPIQVTNANIRQYAGLNGGYNTDVPHEDMTEEELRKEIARLEVQVAHKKMTDGRWGVAPTGAPSGNSPAVSMSGWEAAPETFTEKAKGALEVAGQLATGGLGMVASGLAGIPSALVNGSDAGDTVRKVQEALTYEPKSSKGKEYSKNVGNFFEDALNKASPWMESAVSGIPFIGDQVSPEQKQALGRGTAELGANFVPIEAAAGAIRPWKGVRAAAENAARDIHDHSDRIEPTIETPPPEDPFAEAERANTQMQVEKLQSELEDKAYRTQLIKIEQESKIRQMQQAQAEQYGILSDAQRMQDTEAGQGNLDFSETSNGLTAGPAEPSLRNRTESADFVREPIPYDTTTAPELYKGRPEVVDHGETFDQYQARQPVGEDWQNRYTNGNDFNTPVDNGMREKFQKAQEEAYYKQQAEQQAQLKDAAFKEVDALKERQLQEMENQRQLDIAHQQGQLDLLELHKQGDKSVMGDRATAYLADAIRSGTLRTALETIGGMHENSAYRAIAKYLADRMEGVKTRFHDVPFMRAGDRAYTGYFDLNKGEVGFSRLGSISPHTVLHEATHALTSQFMALNPNHILTRGMRNIFNQMKGRKQFQKQFPHIANEREHLAEAFSNPDYQAFLKKQTVDTVGANRTAWSKFVSAVKNILGIKNPTMANALEHTIDIGKQLADISTEKFRDRAKIQLKNAGMPRKLVDMMAQKERPEPLKPRPKTIQPLKELPGLEHAVSDFAFYGETPEAIIDRAKQVDDIPGNAVEKMGQQLQAGGLFESLKTRNPVVKYTYERVTRAFQEAGDWSREHLTGKNGLKDYMRSLSPYEKEGIWRTMMEYEGQEVLSGDQLAHAGMNEKQIAFYQKYRELSNQFFKEFNDYRVAQGYKPLEPRIAHIAGRFMGDFSRFVFKEVVNEKTGKTTNKIVGRIAGNTKGELARAEKWMAENHPEWKMGEIDYHKIGESHRAADRFQGLMEALNFMEKEDADFKVLMDSYRDFIKSDANNFLNAVRHAKAKAKDAGGILGSEGNKLWEDSLKNAEDGMKAQLAYFEQGKSWIEMQKANDDISKVTSDQDIAQKQPNAIQWSSRYMDHAMGRKPGWLSQMADGVLNVMGETFGVGHSNITGVSNKVKHLMMQKFMGFLNFPFTVTQLMQPFQVHPAMLTLLKQRGMDFSVAASQVRATETYMRSLPMQEVGGRSLFGTPSAFERQAIDYAKKYGIFDVKLSDHTKDINASPARENFDRYVGDLNISAPEHLTRGTTFFFYSHLLKEAGIPAKDVFSAAENLTNFTMTNYHFTERPWVYNHLGWIGDVASTLTRYKHNQYSQMAFYTREGVRGARNGEISASVPMGMFLGTALAFGGIVGMFGYNEADALYTLFSEHVLKKPDTLNNLVLKSGIPEVITHGMFASIGLDMSSRFSHAQTIPATIPGALMPYGSALADMGKSAWDYATDPTDTAQFKRFLKAWLPQSVQGHAENALFTEKLPNGQNLYSNPRTLEGRVQRSDSDMSLRQWGLRTMHESKETTLNYSDSLIKKGNQNIQQNIMDKAERLYVAKSLTPDKARELAKQYVEHEGANFGQNLTTFAKNRMLTDLQRQMMNGSVYDKMRASRRMNASK